MTEELDLRLLRLQGAVDSLHCDAVSVWVVTMMMVLMSGVHCVVCVMVEECEVQARLHSWLQ